MSDEQHSAAPHGVERGKNGVDGPVGALAKKNSLFTCGFAAEDENGVERSKNGVPMSEMSAREYNWRYAHSFPGAICEHYIGGGDWGLDCKLQSGLCGGPGSDRCPLAQEEPTLAERRMEAYR